MPVTPAPVVVRRRDGNRDRLFVVKEQRRHGRSMTEAVPTAYARGRLHRIAELAEALDIGPDGPGAYLEPGRQVLSGPVAARLQHREQLKQARRCLPHDSSVWQQSRNESFRNCL